jgi:predicted amidophosphoribosyltransferase
MNQQELIDLTDSISSELVPMPEDAPDVCPICRTGKRPSDTTCWSCSRVLSLVSRPTRNLIPISYYQTPSPLRERMHLYKESDDEAERLLEGKAVAGILTRYLVEHGDRLVEVFGPWDVVVPVPSTKTSPPSALTTALVTSYSEVVEPPTELLALGQGEMSRNNPSENGFVVTKSVEGVRVLLIDDTYTTGSRLQSAAHALQETGAEVVAGIVIARKINPDARYNTLDLWERQSRIPFNFESLPWWAE